MKYIVPIILLGISAVGFFFFARPLYNDVSDARAKIDSYNLALQNSNTLKSEKEKLTSKYNAIDPANLERLQKMLPDGVDNVRLILEIGEIGRPYGMILKDIKYDTTKKSSATTDTNTVDNKKDVTTKSNNNSNYGVWNLEFSTEGSYANFLNFLKDIENNLRIVDVYSIDFSVDSSGSTNSGTISKTKSDFYKYNFKVRTYWLKK